jgi:hypothetical protein
MTEIFFVIDRPSKETHLVGFSQPDADAGKAAIISLHLE